MRSAILARSLLALGMAALSGCGSLGGMEGAGARCPAVAPYDGKFRAALADEADRLPADDPLRIALSDYLVLRAQAQACQPS